MAKIKDVLRDLNPWWTGEFEIEYGKIDFKFKGLLAFMNRFKVEQGYVISRDKEETQKIGGKVISVVPAFKFFLVSRDRLKV